VEPDAGRCSGIQGVEHGKNVVLVQRLERGERDLIHELKSLAEAAGYSVVATVTQRRRPDPRFNIGVGKVRELAQIVKSRGVCKVIFFNELTPSQTYNLMRELNVEVTDRFALILEIFAQRAGSKEAKLQIELAQLKRELPFIREQLRRAKMGELHGFMGGGEYAIDAYYKHARRRMARIEKELASLRAKKALRWQKRSVENGLYYVALTGYTGAGKTTLFNRLASYSGYVDGKPFATLDAKTKKVVISGRPLIISDTVGFIDSLPRQLLDAFYTTLGELVFADLILLVFDASEPLGEVTRKISASLEVLGELGVAPSRVLAVANKVDAACADDVRKIASLLEDTGLEAVFISALKGLGIEELKARMLARLPNYAVRRVRIDGDTSLLRELYESAFVREVRVEDGGLVALVEGREEWLDALLERCEAYGGNGA